jgi:putative inorganic carbon (HCO3(-)) transporter
MLRHDRIANQVASIALGLVAVALPLAAVPMTFDAFVLPKLLVGRLSVALLACALAYVWFAHGRVTIRRTPLDVAWLLFLVSGLVSSLLSVNSNLSFVGAYLRYDGWWTLATYAALFWLACQLMTDERRVTTVVRMVLAAGAAVAAIALIQVGIADGQTPDTETAFSFGGLMRPDGLFANPNSLAMFLAMLLPLALASRTSSTSRRIKVIGAALALILIAALVMTFSRSGWLGALVGIAIVMSSARSPRRTVLFAGGAVALSALLLAALSSGGWGPALAITERLASLLSPGAGSSGTRLAIWIDTLRLIAERPLFGFGPDTFALVYPHFQTGNWTPGGLIDKAHAEVLQIAATQGVIGVALYLAMLAIVVRAFARRQRSKQGLALFAAVAAYQAALQLNFTSLTVAQPFWLIAAAAFSSWGALRPYEACVRVPFVRVVAIGSLVVAAVLISASVVRSGVADAQYLDGVASARRGDLIRAAGAMRDARELAPTRESYAIGAGDVASALASRTRAPADWDDARRAYESSSALGASDPGVYLRLAAAYERLGRTGDAAAARGYAEMLGRADLRRGP